MYAKHVCDTARDSAVAATEVMPLCCQGLRGATGGSGTRGGVRKVDSGKWTVDSGHQTEDAASQQGSSPILLPSLIDEPTASEGGSQGERDGGRRERGREERQTPPVTAAQSIGDRADHMGGPGRNTRTPSRPFPRGPGTGTDDH